MTCKEIEKQIPLFLTDSLEEDELETFVEHIKQCKDCEEELAIQYLTVVGMARLEEGASFALDDELAAKINRADRKIKINRRIEKICNRIEMAAILVLGITVVYLVW
jgi:hypothetical protein